jgi:hypothetical protein
MPLDPHIVWHTDLLGARAANVGRMSPRLRDLNPQRQTELEKRLKVPASNPATSDE